MLGDEVYEKLSSKYELDYEEFIAPKLSSTLLFEFIVAVILSQNTSDENAWKAYTNLKRRLPVITPEGIFEMKLDELSSCIRVAGMQYQRALKLKKLAEVFVERNAENVLTEYIKNKKYDDARRFLISLPGVGAKTADVVLLMRYAAPTFPVDTHITRITCRLGFVNRKNYELIRSFWMKNTSPKNYLLLHLLLITHGRETCRSREPLCSDCVLKEYCRFYMENAK